MIAGYVYVLAFSNGTIKVGRTKNARQRLSAHKSDARKFGTAVTDQWFSPLHAEWIENETALMKIATELGGVAQGTEYFNGADFAAVVEIARALPFTSANPETVPAVKEEDAPPRFAGLSVTAEKLRIAEFEADRERRICELLRLCVKAEWGPETLREWAAEPGSSYGPIFADLADALEAKTAYETVMNGFINRAKAAAGL